MSRERKKLAGRVAGALCILAIAAPVHGGDGVSMYSYVSGGSCNPCDPVGRGTSDEIEDPATEGSRNPQNGVRLDFSNAPTEGNAWFMDFAAPNNIELQTGLFGGAISFNEGDDTGPRLEIARSPGTKCEDKAEEIDSTGNFQVSQVEYDQFGEPIRFQGNFEQWCFDYGPGLGLHGSSVEYALDGVLGPTTLTPGNILVTFRDYLAQPTKVSRVFEYDNPPERPSQWQPSIPSQVIPIRRPPDFPVPGAVPDPDEKARDLVYDGSRNLYIFNGTYEPKLTTFDTATGAWRNDTVAGWDIQNIQGRGNPVIWRNYVFVNDEDVSDFDNGIIRFDTADDFSAVRFGSGAGNSYQDLDVGFDGKLYASRATAFETIVDVYDPDTMAQTATVTLARDVAAIAVNARGEFYGAELTGGNLHHFDPSGALIKSVNPLYVSGLIDLALSRSGQILLGDSFRGLVLTDESFTSPTPYFLDYNGNGVNVAWVEPPPTALQLSDFETGDTSQWHDTTGEFAGVIDVQGGAAKSGSFGLGITFGTTCTDPVDNIIPGPSATGTFKGCNSVVAENLDFVAPGGVLAAGDRVVIGDDASVASDTVAVIDPGFTSRLGWVEEHLPNPSGAYNAQFEINLDSLTLDPTDDIVHFVGLSVAGDEEFRATLIHNETLNENRLILAARLDDGSYEETPFGEQTLLQAGWRSLRFLWKAGDGDGYFLLSLDGLDFVGFENLDNDTREVSTVRWGAAGGTLGASTSGSLWLDDYSSWM